MAGSTSSIARGIARVSNLRLRRQGSSGFRAKRFSVHIRPLIVDIISAKGSCSIIDLGGDIEYWNGFDIPPSTTILLINQKPSRTYSDNRFISVEGDARRLSDYRDGEFDLVHSNSVIEHVGSWASIQAFAGEVRRLAPRYYVQTPNFWFPLDPHTRMLFFHWAPGPIQRRLLRRKRRGHIQKATNMDEAMLALEGTSMLDAAQMRALFPDAKIISEKLFGLKKSLIAMR